MLKDVSAEDKRHANADIARLMKAADALIKEAQDIADNYGVQIQHRQLTYYPHIERELDEDGEVKYDRYAEWNSSWDGEWMSSTDECR